jgi:hypothetical protein
MYVYQSHARSALLLPGTEFEHSRARPAARAEHSIRFCAVIGSHHPPTPRSPNTVYKARLGYECPSRITSYPVHKASHFRPIANVLSQVFMMLAFILAPLALLASALAAPVAEVHALKNFMLLSSPIKSTSTANTTGLNLVDPYHQTNFLLRAQEDAGSVFNLTTYAPLFIVRGCS